MCSPHPRTPGAYKVASGDAPGHWPMFVTYSGCTMRAFAKLYDYILHQLGPHKHLRRRHRAMVSNPGQSPRPTLCVTKVLLYYYY